jgi:4-amino-4-deoxy-L-arabinose transferase-like glycosyltransferase
MSVGTPVRGRWWHGPDRSVVGVGLAGVLLTFGVLASLQALTIPPFHPHDEVSHVGYALAVSRGELPTIDSPIPGGETPILQRQLTNRRPANRTIWTANHPPLYYVLAAAPLRLGVNLGRPLGGIRAARLINVGVSLAGLALVVLLGRELVPARPELAVAAAGLAALVPGLVRTSAFVYNDALMFTLATAALVLIAQVLRRGPTPGRVALLALLAAASALTRATGLLVAAVAAVAVLVAVLLHDRRPARVRVLLAAAAGAAVVVVTVAAAGWFYLRNRALYGSATGTGELLQKFSRPPRGTLPQAVVDPSYWHDHLRRLWELTEGVSAGDLLSRSWGLTFLPVLGLALAGIGWLRRAQRPGLPLLLAWLACLGLAVLVELSAVSFYSLGGNPHGRYLLPGLSVLAIAAAAGVAGLPGPPALPTIAVLPALVLVNLIAWQRYLTVTLRPDDGQSVILVGMRSGHLPGWLLLPAGVLLAAGLAAQAWAVWTLSARRTRPVTGPVPAQPEHQPVGRVIGATVPRPDGRA